jgi:SWI/SNF-related matrix-associated actin-dependent regulator of chromatin subfamily A-like protein 1
MSALSPFSSGGRAAELTGSLADFVSSASERSSDGTGVSNLEELNLLTKEVMLRRKKYEVLDLPEKSRSWVPVSVESAAARNAQRSVAEWFAQADPSRPNDTDFLARLTKLRVALHKAKHRAVEECIHDVVSTDRKVIVFTAFTEGLKRHRPFSAMGA